MSDVLRNNGLRVVGKEEQEGKSPYPKASLFLRFGARMIDAVIAWILFVATGPSGIVMSLLYILFADGMFQGQSPGKKMFGVKVIYLPTQTGARHRDSFLRNAPLGLILVLAMMPELGLIAFLGGLLVIGGIEARMIYKDETGARLGDVWAQTQVVDTKIPIGAVGLVPGREEARATGRLKQSVHLKQHFEDPPGDDIA